MKDIVEKIIDNCQDDYTVNELENIQNEARDLWGIIEDALMKMDKLKSREELSNFVGCEFENIQSQLKRVFEIVKIKEEMDIESKEYERTFG